MKKNLNYIIGISLISIGLILKSLLNHNIEFWKFVKYTSTLLTVFGILALFFSIWSKVIKKPNKSFLKLPKKWAVYYLKNGITLLFSLLILIGIETLGKSLNYRLREFYLSHDTATTDAIIDNYVRFYMAKVEDVDFYLIKFKINNQDIEKGLLVGYSEKDGISRSGKITLEDNIMEVKKMEDRRVEIIYSKKFPSFLKIINLK